MLHNEARLRSGRDSVEARFRLALEGFIEHRFAGRARVRDCAMISGRLSPVYRVGLAGPAPDLPSTLIVKRLGDPWFGDMTAPDVPAEFREEVAVYHYLENLAGGFIRRPRCLGIAPEGLLVLEDLGTEDCRAHSLEEVGPMVAALLAELHAATWRRLDSFAAARAVAGADGGPDRRYDGEVAAQERFRVGVEILAGWAEALGLGPASRVTLLARQAAETIQRSEMMVLIHDDLANARQCVVRGDELMLLDFEAAKPAHALRDLAKIMLGKFERDLETGHMVWVNPGFSSATIEVYRSALADCGGPVLPDDAWASELGAAMVHGALMQAGSLHMLIGQTRVTGDFLPNLRTLFARLEEVLSGSAAQREIRSVLSGVAARFC